MSRRLRFYSCWVFNSMKQGNIYWAAWVLLSLGTTPLDGCKSNNRASKPEATVIVDNASNFFFHPLDYLDPKISDLCEPPKNWKTLESASQMSLSLFPALSDRVPIPFVYSVFPCSRNFFETARSGSRKVHGVDGSRKPFLWLLPAVRRHLQKWTWNQFRLVGWVAWFQPARWRFGLKVYERNMSFVERNGLHASPLTWGTE